MINSRMKDFYDIWLMTQHFSFEGRLLAEAIRSTFQRRDTELPATLPVALTTRFGQDREKQTLWQAFLTRSRLETGQPDFAEIVSHIAEFLAPLSAALANHQDFNPHWSPGTGWTT